MLSSNHTPRYLRWFCGMIGVSFIAKFVLLDTAVLLPRTIIAWVFSPAISKSCSWVHFWIRLIPRFPRCVISLSSLAATRRARSSAYRVSSEQSGMSMFVTSFIRMFHSVGPSTEPCGTPPLRGYFLPAI